MSQKVKDLREEADRLKVERLLKRLEQRNLTGHGLKLDAIEVKILATVMAGMAQNIESLAGTNTALRMGLEAQKELERKVKPPRPIKKLFGKG